MIQWKPFFIPDLPVFAITWLICGWTDISRSRQKLPKLRHLSASASWEIGKNLSCIPFLSSNIPSLTPIFIYFHPSNSLPPILIQRTIGILVGIGIQQLDVESPYLRPPRPPHYNFQKRSTFQLFMTCAQLSILLCTVHLPHHTINTGDSFWWWSTKGEVW